MVSNLVSIDIRFGSTTVPVLLGTGPAFSREADDAIRALGPDRVLLVVDSRVATLFPEDVERFFAAGHRARCGVRGAGGGIV